MEWTVHHGSYPDGGGRQRLLSKLLPADDKGVSVVVRRRMAPIHSFQGATDTTFYVIAVQFGSACAGRGTRCPAPFADVTADVTGTLLAYPFSG